MRPIPSVAATYVYASYIDDVVSMRRGGADYYFLHDDQWNVVALTDASGVVLERVRYGESGQPAFVRASDGATASKSFFGNPYAFTGRRWDSATGLYYYRHRYYDPRTGRFTTRDPIGIWGDWINVGNGYTYTGNNPWSYVDPYGLSTGRIISDIAYKAAEAGRAVSNGLRDAWNEAQDAGRGLLDEMEAAGRECGRAIGTAAVTAAGVGEQVGRKANAAPFTVVGFAVGGTGYVHGTGLHSVPFLVPPLMPIFTYPMPWIGLGENDVQFGYSPLFVDKERPYALGNTTHYSTLVGPDDPAIRYDGLTPHEGAKVKHHESAHPYQYEAYGLLFPILYLWDELFSDFNRFERAADNYADYRGCQEQHGGVHYEKAISPVPPLF